MRVADHAAAGAAHARAAIATDMTRRAGRTARYGADAQALDQQLDRAVSALDGYLASQARMFGESSARGKAAATLRRALFPDGAAPITSATFPEEHARVEVLLTRLGDAAFAGERAELPDLTAMTARLTAINTAFGDSIAGYDRDVPTADQVRQATALAQNHLCETVALILAEYAVTAMPDVDADRDVNDDARADLLEPIARQNVAIAEARRRRRLPADVDPDTGEETGGEAAEPGEPIEPGEPVESACESPGEPAPPLRDAV